MEIGGIGFILFWSIIIALAVGLGWLAMRAFGSSQEWGRYYPASIFRSASQVKVGAEPICRTVIFQDVPPREDDRIGVLALHEKLEGLGFLMTRVLMAGNHLVLVVENDRGLEDDEVSEALRAARDMFDSDERALESPGY